jgi:hypothetical protein
MTLHDLATHLLIIGFALPVGYCIGSDIVMLIGGIAIVASLWVMVLDKALAIWRMTR